MGEKRRKIWIDRLQTLLSIRLALYFVSYQFSVWLLFAIERSTSDRLQFLLGPWAGLYAFAFITATAALLGALFIWDVIKVVHRVVGPLVRFRRAIKSVTAGEDVALIVLRKGDHLLDLQDDFNEMLRALEQRGAVVVVSPGARKVEKPVASA